MSRFLYICGLLIVGIVIAVIMRNMKFRRHVGLPREIFVPSFVNRGVPELIAGSVYDFYKSQAGPRSFSPAPQDRIAETYGRHDVAGIEDDIQDLFGVLKISYPPSSKANVWPNPLVTLDDMIMWIDFVRRQ